MTDIKKFDFESDKILASLSSKDREKIFEKAEPLFFRRGKLVFYEDGIPTGIFLLKSGRAKIFKTGIEGRDQIFYIYRSGDLLGYHALLCQEKYEDSCEALEDCEMLFVGKEAFDDLLEKISGLKMALIKNMGHEFGVLVNQITVLAQKPLRERLALYLLILNKKYTENGELNIEVPIRIPREDLANLIGTARESLGRLLKEFREEGLIKVKSREIFLLDIKKLESFSSSQYI